MASSNLTASLRLYALLTFAVVALVSPSASAQSQPGSGKMVASAPMYILPDARRTPLTILPAGTIVRVLAREGDWYEVVFRDPYWGDRTGYVRAASIQVDSAPPQPERAPATAPGARPPAPAASTQNPPRPSAPPVRRSSMAPWAERGDLWVNAMYLATSDAFSATTAITKNVESGSVITSYSAGHPPVFDAGVRGLVARHLAIGAAVTWMSQNGTGDVSASLPHPFFFNALRTVAGSADGLSRDELAIHVQVSGLVPLGRVMQLAIFGGPSYFNVKQGLVTDVTVAETYPYDTAAFISATTTTASAGNIGFNAGVDVAGRIAKHIGAGFTARYSRADVQIPSGPTDEVTVRAGGLQVGGGIRFGF
jgi:hypothetical protein